MDVEADDEEDLDLAPNKKSGEDFTHEVILDVDKLPATVISSIGNSESDKWEEVLRSPVEFSLASFWKLMVNE